MGSFQWIFQISLAFCDLMGLYFFWVNYNRGSLAQFVKIFQTLQEWILRLESRLVSGTTIMKSRNGNESNCNWRRSCRKEINKLNRRRRRRATTGREEAKLGNEINCKMFRMTERINFCANIRRLGLTTFIFLRFSLGGVVAFFVVNSPPFKANWPREWNGIRRHRFEWCE